MTNPIKAGRRWRQRCRASAKAIGSKKFTGKPGGLEYRRWAKNNTNRVKQYLVSYRDQKLKEEEHYTGEDFKRICATQKYRCAACRKKRKLTVDHIQPLSKGGTNWPSNIQGLCLSCNSSKSNKDPIEYMQSNGYLL
jgi:5-methylcytosine-specific restriction endonuclease McrA